MKTKIVGIFVCMLLIATALPAVGTFNHSNEGKNPVDKTLNGGWIQTYGESGKNFGNCVQQTSDGGYILAIETTAFSDGDLDSWLVKTDENGNIEWDKTFGGGEDDMPLFVRQTTDGGYIITGFTMSYGAGVEDAWLIKTDADGNEEWNQTYGGTEYDFGYTVYETIDGYIINGGTQSFGAGDFDYWLVKTDADGNEEWNQTYGGSGIDVCRRMVQTSDDGYIISGYTIPIGLFKKASGWLVKTDADGNVEWDKHIYHGNRHGGLRGIRQTSDGGYILAGEANNIAFGQIYLGGGDMWLVKTDADGNMEWEKTFGKIFFEDGAFDVEITDDGGYIVAGFIKGIGGVIKQQVGLPPLSKTWLVKTDADGNMEWEEEYSLGVCYYGEKTSDGGYIVTGAKRPYVDGEAFLIKIDSSDI